jgi:hypothetical protein
VADTTANDPKHQQTLVALELIRRAVAESAATQVRAILTGRDQAPAYQPQPIHPSNPPVVMTPGGPAVDPTRLFGGGAEAPGKDRSGAAAAGPKLNYTELYHLQQQAAADLEAAAKMEKENAQKEKLGGGVGGKITAALGGVAGGMARLFGGLTSRLALLSGMMSQTTSGFDLVNRTVQLFYAVLAPVLLPVLFLFAAAMLYLSDKIMKDLWPAFNNLWKAVGPTLVTAFEGLATVIGKVVGGLGDLLNWIGEKTGADKRQTTGTGAGLGLAAGYGLGGRGGAVAGALAGNEVEKTVTSAGKALEGDREALGDVAKDVNPLGAPTVGATGSFAGPVGAMAARQQQEQDRKNQEFMKSAEGQATARGNAAYMDAVKAGKSHEEALAASKAAKAAQPGTPGAPGQPGVGDALTRLTDAVTRPPAERPAGTGAGNMLMAAGGYAMGRMPGQPGAPGAPAGPREPSFKQAMLDMLKTFEMSVGPKAAFGEIGASQVQNAVLAALNQDPIQERMLRANEFAVQLLRQLVENTEPGKGSYPGGK